MSLRVSGKNLDIGNALRTHIHARIETATSKYFPGKYPNTILGHVTIEPEGAGFRTDCTLHLKSGITLQANADAHDPYASFNRAADRIEKRLQRHKSRLRKQHGSDADTETAQAGTVSMATDYVLAAPTEDEEEIGDFEAVVIAESPLRLKQMPVADAVMELDLSGAPVMVFRHAAHGRLNIVYRRMDGHIGWIDPVAATPTS